MISDKQKRIREIQNTPEFAAAHALNDKMSWDAIEGKIPFSEYEKTMSSHPGYPQLQEWSKLQEWMRTKPSSGHDAYRRLAGEAEARATQARMNMGPAERRAMFPYDSYDVPVDQLIVRQEGLLGPQMAVLPGALDRARGLLGEIALGQKPKPIDIAELTPQQFAELNAARKSRGQPEFTRPTVIYNGKHHYQSRSADGDSIDEMLLQIANSLDDRAGVVMSPRGPALQSPEIRVNPRGETVQDRAVLEGGGDRPTWLYSAIPKKKAP